MSDICVGRLLPLRLGRGRGVTLSSCCRSGLDLLSRLLTFCLGPIMCTAALGLGRFGGGPEGEVVAQELHDEGRVAVRVLTKAVEFCYGLIKAILGEVTGTVRRVQDLIVED